jgi:DNA-binding LacI/PurR family transcriptional regulator
MALSGRERRARRPNIHDVAARARVSAGTVSNVLTGRRAVVPEVAERVRAAVAKLGYVTDIAASHLRSSQSTVVGVLVPDLTNRFFATFVGTVEGLVRADGYRVLVASSGLDGAMEAAELRALTAWKPVGLIVIPCEDRFESRAVLAGTRIPVVVADRFGEHPDCDAVGVDNADAVSRAASHLLELGHRRVMILASTLDLNNVRQRVAGARAILAAAPRSPAPEVLEVGSGLEQASEALFARLGRANAPTAIIALTNTTTLAALKALSRRKLRVPRDISLVGFDDDDWMEVVRPGITAVRQPLADMARAAWSRLRERLAGDTSGSVQVQLPCTLVLRDSTAACARGRPDRRNRNRTAARTRGTVS